MKELATDSHRLNEVFWDEFMPKTTSRVLFHLSLEEVGLWPAKSVPKNLQAGEHISSRSADDIYRATGYDVEQLLRGQRGKVIFLGNGLSPLPLYVSHGYIVDTFSYDALASDLSLFLQIFKKKRIGGGFMDDAKKKLINIQALLSHRDAGYLQIVQYVVGSGSVPDGVQNSQLVVNIRGPSKETLLEQVGLLADGGMLMTDENIVDKELFGCKRVQSFGMCFLLKQ